MNHAIIILIAAINLGISILYLRNNLTSRRASLSFSRFVSNIMLAIIWAIASTAVIIAQLS